MLFAGVKEGCKALREEVKRSASLFRLPLGRAERSGGLGARQRFRF